MNAPIRQPQPSAPEAPLDPAVLRMIEALAEAQARRDYDAGNPKQDSGANS